MPQPRKSKPRHNEPFIPTMAVDAQEYSPGAGRSAPPPAGRDPLLASREATHGSFARNAHAAIGMSRALGVLYSALEVNNQSHDVVFFAIDHILTKLARIANGNPLLREHWDDIRGYAVAVLETLETGK